MRQRGVPTLRRSAPPFNNVDPDPPVLKTNSTPPKNTKVKAGDQIKIHATASERHADGHKSWPSGVKSLQFIANGTLVDSKDYGMKPPPCEVRVFEPVYTVPKNPPEIVHLRIYTEDVTGHGTFEEADFPTRGDWYGCLDWSVHQMVPSGPQDWLGHADLILDDDGQGGLTGTLSGTENQKLAIEGCHGVTNWTVNARLTGTVTTSAQKITINATDRHSTRPEMASCGEARTGGDIFMWPQFTEMLRKLAPSADGSSYQYQREIHGPRRDWPLRADPAARRAVRGCEIPLATSSMESSRRSRSARMHRSDACSGHIAASSPVITGSSELRQTKQ
jgi:hypothetical protein